MTNLTVMIGAFSGASIPHLGHPFLGNALWLGATAFASASIALYGRSALDNWKARRDPENQATNHPGADRTGNAPSRPRR